MGNQKLLAIIGDIIDSRNIEYRIKVQEELNKIIKEINMSYKNYIVSKWTITLGDEFQVLMKPNLEIFKMLDYISYRMDPIKIRYGIGLGEIYTDIDYEKSIGADGPAYWNARSAIEFIHNNNNYGNSKILFRGKTKSDNIINHLLSYTDWMKENWTNTQKEVLYTLLESGIYSENFEQKALAKKLNISESAMSRRVKTSGIRLYLSSKNSIAKEIEYIGGDKDR
ncbi:MAG TPA: SatD family protein [Tissierellales bacterium]|nr:SatD family protein [Tissierellales bacterium]